MTTSSFPHLGKSQGSTTPKVQWSSLALEEPPSWSWLTSRPGKYALAQCLENYQDVVFLTPLLSPADLSAVFTMKRKLRNVSMENESFHDQWMLETSRSVVFQKRVGPFFTRKCFRRDKYATCGLRVTLQCHSNIIICQSDSQFRP